MSRRASCVIAFLRPEGHDYAIMHNELCSKKQVMSEKIHTYRDLDIWKKGIELVKGIYDLTEAFPKNEIYSLSSQMRRAAISIPSNTAEGFRRQHNKEYKQFLFIALGSCAELETQITIARILGFTSETRETELLEKLDHICRMVSNLIKKL
jgi:four helix bundle protein